MARRRRRKARAPGRDALGRIRKGYKLTAGGRCVVVRKMRRGALTLCYRPNKSR